MAIDFGAGCVGGMLQRRTIQHQPRPQEFSSLSFLHTISVLAVSIIEKQEKIPWKRG